MYGSNCRAQHLVEFGASFAVDEGIACALGFKQLGFHSITAQLRITSTMLDCVGI